MQILIRRLLWTLSFMDVYAAVLSLSVCPSDTVITIGQTVTLVCATLPGKQIRWSAKSPDNIIFNGKTMYYEYGVSGRFNATPSNDGQVELNITGVQLEDAGLYGCHSLSTREEVHAELVVIDSLLFIEKARMFQSTDHQQPTLEHSCTVKYAGNLRPIMEWLDQNGNAMPQLHTSTFEESVPGGLEIIYKVNVSYQDLSNWPDACRVTFSLKVGCTQALINESFSSQGPTAYYVRRVSMQWFTEEHLFTYGIHIVFILISVTLVCWVCILRHRLMLKVSSDAEDDNSTRTSPDSHGFRIRVLYHTSQKILHMFTYFLPTKCHKELKTNQPQITALMQNVM